MPHISNIFERIGKAQQILEMAGLYRLFWDCFCIFKFSEIGYE